MRLRDPRTGRPAVPVLVVMWLLAFGVYAGYFQAQWVFGERPIYFITGDEPHYLTVAVSLTRDRDLDILNNYRDRDYASFYPYHLGDPRDPQDMHALYGREGHLYSKHSLGLPLLLAPVLGLGGHGDVKLFLMGLTALLSVQAFALALDVTGRLRPSLVAWVLVAFTAPLLLYADQIYPEVPGALLLVLALRVVARQQPARWQWIAAGACTGLLPWLHLRYVPLAATAGVALVARLAVASSRGRPSVAAGRLLALGLPALAAGGALWWLDFRLYGGVPRVDEYGAVSLANLATGAPGMLLDQQYGLLIYGPALLVALLGLPLLWGPDGGLAGRAVLLTVGAYFAFIGTFSYWFGAFSPPARMLVPVVPLLAVPAALAVARWRRRWFRLLVASLLALSWSMAHLLVDVPRLRYAPPDAEGQLLAYLSGAWNRDVSGWLPSFVTPNPGATLWAATALLVVVLLWLALEWPLRPSRGARRPAAAPGPAPVPAPQA